MDPERALLAELSRAWALTPLEVGLRNNPEIRLILGRNLPFPDVHGAAALIGTCLARNEYVDQVTRLGTRRLRYVGVTSRNGTRDVHFIGDSCDVTLHFSPRTYPVVGIIPDLSFHPPLHERYSSGIYVSVCAEDAGVPGSGLEEMLFLRK